MFSPYCRVSEAMKHIFPEQDNSRKRLKLMTSSLGQTTTVPLTTRWMTSLLKHHIVYLAHEGHRNMVWGGYHMDLCYMLCLSDFLPKLYQGLFWMDKTKDGSYPVISSADVKEIQPRHTSHPATRVRDMTPHMWQGISPWLRPDTSSVETVSVCECVGSHQSGGETDKAESIFVMRFCF